jgi:hypothetical protein
MPSLEIETCKVLVLSWILPGLVISSTFELEDGPMMFDGCGWVLGSALPEGWKPGEMDVGAIGLSCALDMGVKDETSLD